MIKAVQNLRSLALGSLGLGEGLGLVVMHCLSLSQMVKSQVVRARCLLLVYDFILGVLHQTCSLFVSYSYGTR